MRDPKDIEINGTTLDVILEKHRAWLDDEDGGERANLHSANLHSANLGYANLGSANLHSANLHSANLHSANLGYANLHSANLHSANLRYADLRYANLRYANLHSANLHHANLRYADLHSANLRYADLEDLLSMWGTAGNGGELKSIFCDTYQITYTFTHMQIGCEKHLIQEWWRFDRKRIIEMDGKEAWIWWKRWKPMLQQIIELSPAVSTQKQDEAA